MTHRLQSSPLLSLPARSVSLAGKTLLLTFCLLPRSWVRASMIEKFKRWLGKQIVSFCKSKANLIVRKGREVSEYSQFWRGKRLCFAENNNGDEDLIGSSSNQIMLVEIRECFHLMCFFT